VISIFAVWIRVDSLLNRVRKRLAQQAPVDTHPRAGFVWRAQIWRFRYSEKSSLAASAVQPQVMALWKSAGVACGILNSQACYGKECCGEVFGRLGGSSAPSAETRCYSVRVNTQDIVTALDAEINRLQQARDAIAAGLPSTKRRGRPAAVAAFLKEPKAKRTLSAEARRKIAATQRKRWAKQKKSQ
jgi:hypothetical protein